MGIDARRLKAQVAIGIEAYLASDIDFPADMAEAFWRADIAANDEFVGFVRLLAAEHALDVLEPVA